MPVPRAFSFRVHKKCRATKARTGRIVTPHGAISTPVFMPVGTYGAVKTLLPTELKAAGAEIILGNTFHLSHRPGEAVIKAHGGLAAYNRWGGPTLTDSGGFQVFSLSKFRRITDEGVLFQHPLDGKRMHFTPLSVLKIQKDIGATFAMQLDECVPGNGARAPAETALARTQRWAEISLKKAEKYADTQKVLPICQGAGYPQLRKKAAQHAAGLSSFAVAIGGLAVGETKKAFLEALEATCPHLPTEKPRYLMGVGDPLDILEAVASGVDMFDCVAPTRVARHGAFYGTGLTLHNIKKAEHTASKKALLSGCPCTACKGGYSRSFLRQLFLSGDPLAARLISQHNLTQLFAFMADIRASIAEGTFSSFARRVRSAHKKAATASHRAYAGATLFA